MELAQIVTLLNQVTDAVQEIEKKSTQTINNDIDERNILLAKQYPIKGHYLVDKTETVRKQYIGFLLAFCNGIFDQDCKQRKQYYICRIIASYDKNVNLKNYITQSLRVDMKAIYDLVEVLDSEATVYFAVDLLVLFMMDANKIGKKEYEAISNILEFLQMSKKSVKKVAQIAKSIVEQDFDQLVENRNVEESINYDYFWGYFSDTEHTTVVHSIINAELLTGNVLVENATISNHQEYLEFSEYQAKCITFRNCNFENIKGIKGYKEKVFFDNCKFENNYFDENELNKHRRASFGNLYTECENNYVFIQGNRISMKNCIFSSIRVSKSVLDIVNGEIQDCKFIDCKGKELPCSYLFQLDNVKLTNSVFNNCIMTTNHSKRSHTTGAILSIKKGFMGNCIFDNCEARGETIYGRYAIYNMQIIRAISTRLENNTFNKCKCLTGDTTYGGVIKTVENYIVGMKNSIERGNKFKECSTEHLGKIE